MKKIILSLIAVMACMSISAQVVKVYKSTNGGEWTLAPSTTGTYTNTGTDKYKVVFEAGPDPNLLTGKFSVSATKQVQFTKGNLYWDGSAWHFEANQTDYQTSWNTSHIDHFYWSKDASVMYAETYSDASRATTDAFFFCEANKDANKVDGKSGYYSLSKDDWTYLLKTRTNASNLYKLGVTVTNGGTNYTNCLIIAPDDFSGTLQSSYTLEDVNAAGLVCLPAAGDRGGSSLNRGGSRGYYWSATPHSSGQGSAYYLLFISSSINPADDFTRDNGYSLRLVHGL